MKQTLLLVGNPDPMQVGAHLVGAAESLGIHPVVCDVSEAYEGPLWRNRVNWWLRGRLPSRLTAFSAKVLEVCRGVRPTWLLATGIAPLEEAALKEIGKLQVRRLNYLTDDPWNPAHRAPWFLQAVSQYDYVFSPRRATLSDLRAHGCLSACYLPFAYAPELHFPEAPADDAERARLASDIVFAGGADRDRVPYMQALIRTGFKVALYGGYWERYPQTAGSTRGHADAHTLRKAVGAAKIALCLVRRANRDGNVMRSFELPAMGACMLTEDTVEHREILGNDGETVTYFRTQEEMIEKLRWLLAHDDERHRLKEAAHRVITRGHHTYRDRLEAMLERVNGMTQKIAIVVQGRFYTFDMAKALLARGHDVHLFTNYPRWVVARFGFPPERVTSYWPHGIAARVFTFLKARFHVPDPEAWLHMSFGRWAARHVSRREWDAVYCFSGVSEELLNALRESGSPSWLFRSSSHIRTQAELLETEERRAGGPIDRPSVWMIQREEREYAKADVIVTLSGFAERTFDGTGNESKVVMVPLGVDVSSFRPTPDKIEARRQRILSGAKLRVLFVGTKSYRKGLLDLAQIARTLAGRFEFRLVGPDEAQARGTLHKLGAHAELVPAMPEAQLREAYAWGDVFVFPTIEDGFAAVLMQAYAAGLPILATTNCGAPDFIRGEETGWILPIRAPDRFAERLEWCHHNRTALANMVTRIADGFQPRTWDDMAVDLEALIHQRCQNRRPMAGART